MSNNFRPTRPPLRRPPAPDPDVAPRVAYRVWGGVAGFGLLIIVVGLFFLGRPRGTVTGRVTFRGKPVYTGSVIIVGKDGVAVAGAIETDGTYSVQKAPVGEVTIGVVSKDPVYLHRVGALRKSREPVPASALTVPAGLDRRKWFPIPKEYEEPVRSGLTFSVKKGDNQFDIDLK